MGIGAWLVGAKTMTEFAGRKAKLEASGRRIGRTDQKAAAALRVKAHRKLPGGVDRLRYRVAAMR